MSRTLVPSGRRTARRALIWFSLLPFLALSVFTIWHHIDTWERGRRRWLKFHDFSIFQSTLAEYPITGTIYATNRPDFYDPGSPVYKYPPVLAAAIKLFAGLPTHEVGLIFLWMNVTALLGGLLLLLLKIRPGRWRAALIVLLFPLWQPMWETLAGLQCESGLFLLLSLSFVWLRSGRYGRGALPIGIAGAVKVYPWVLLLSDGIRLRWRTLAWAAAGAIATLAAAALILPPRLTVEYFAKILPRTGGVAVGYENIGLMAQLARLVMYVQGTLLSPNELVYQCLNIVGPARVPGVRPLVLGLYGLIAGALLLVVFRRFRRLRRSFRGPSEALILCLTLSGVLLLIPTSWLNYQALLAIPLIAGIALARPPREDPAIWVLIVLALLAGGIDGNGALFKARPAICSITRGLLPLLLGGVSMRLMETEGAPLRSSELSQEPADMGI